MTDERDRPADEIEITDDMLEDAVDILIDFDIDWNDPFRVAREIVQSVLVAAQTQTKRVGTHQVQALVRPLDRAKCHG